MAETRKSGFTHISAVLADYLVQRKPEPEEPSEARPPERAEATTVAGAC